MFKNTITLIIFFAFTLCLPYVRAEDPVAGELSRSELPKDLVIRAMKHWRGESSFTTAEMNIIRPSYSRTLGLEAKTSGEKNSLVKFVFPKKDAGNATLMKGEDIWTYNPRTSRVVKIPPSMKSHGWMGSDFSYQDLGKDDSIVEHYEHEEISSFEKEGVFYRVIRAVPRPSAPVVWGREELEIRDDLIIETHRFYDQSGVLVKTLHASEIGMLGGRKYPLRIVMKNEESGNTTELLYSSAEFDVPIASSIFSITNLHSGGS